MPKQQIEIDNTKMHLEEKLASYFGVTPSDASIDQMYKAVSMSVLDILLEKKKQFNRKVKEQKSKRIYYLCMEFLVGRSLKTNLYNLGIVDVYREVLKEYGSLYPNDFPAGELTGNCVLVKNAILKQKGNDALLTLSLNTDYLGDDGFFRFTADKGYTGIADNGPYLRIQLNATNDLFAH